MEKQKRWQLAIIIAVIALTLYNILPTVIFYSKPLRAPIDEIRAESIEANIANRVNALEEESIEWIHSFAKLIQVKPKSVQLKKEDPSIIAVEFSDKKQADLFRQLLPRAGLEIPFVPAQLGLMEEDQGTLVTVIRRQGFHFDKQDLPDLFQFGIKQTSDGNISPLYFTMVMERATSIVMDANLQPLMQQAENTLAAAGDSASIRSLTDSILTLVDAFGDKAQITKRYLHTIGLANNFNLSTLISKIENEQKQLTARQKSIREENSKRQEMGELVSSEELELAESLESEAKQLVKVVAVLRANKDSFQNEKLYSREDVVASFKAQFDKDSSASSVYTFSIAKCNPLLSDVTIDWANDHILLKPQQDVEEYLTSKSTDEIAHIKKEAVGRLLANEIARIGQNSGEQIVAATTGFCLKLSNLQDSKSYVAFNLHKVADKLSGQLLDLICHDWNPTHTDLSREHLPCVGKADFLQLPATDKRLCLVVVAEETGISTLQGLRPGSLYVVIRGLKNIMEQYSKLPDSEDALLFSKEFSELAAILYKRGFIGYPGASIGPSSELASDYVFEMTDYYSMLLKATREDFSVHGTKEYAVLEFSDVEQRIITENKIEDAIQEDLLRWKEAYSAAQVNLNPTALYTVPKPVKNALFENMKLSMKKYFRGDDSKILHWGLDLSGGKSVRIALVDHSGKRVETDQDLRQAVNELYTRINKMGVSERAIRIENSTILLDFPGSQAMSASELVKASAMYFHLANEQFGIFNKNLAKEVNEFLQDVWNEAVVSNRKDMQSINEIAYERLKSVSTDTWNYGPKSSARILYEQGLRLAHQGQIAASSSFDDSLSMVARYAGDDSIEWSNQTHPLLIVFHNYALEGASLENIQTGYDPSKGNTLMFGVRAGYTGEKAGSPRDDFYAWTAPFSEEKILGTPREVYTQGKGYRMAVILNGNVISAPSLNSPLRDHAMITGSFSQREVAKLATDLSAGSLSFTPKILSEQNVSPELGQAERKESIIAFCVAVISVVAIMCSYYHFAGLIASIAVLFNMLVIWAVMQNLGAVLTLPGIAGMVLTVGMAVDANVLVFERIREEFKNSGRIASAIQIGYRKAFSAIVDSNITTILAAIILLQFDCGPIRGFATTLIIGIIASMFTALFMTRYFFAGWVKNPAHKELTMAEWVKGRNFDFLKLTRPVVYASITVVLIGAGCLVSGFKSMVGMDFTGGYSLLIELEQKPGVNYREAVTKALESSGIVSREFQIRELGRPNFIRLQLSNALTDEGQPFYGLPEELGDDAYTYSYQKNPRIDFIVKALETQGLAIKDSAKNQLANSWTTMSGQFSEVMRNNAIMALGLALIAVLFYIAFRFEWKYAVSSVLALLHDVILTLAVVSIAYKLGAPIQINLEFVGAIMTIIGYSLNDTIIVFDRIREDIRLYRKLSFAEIINLALNLTLSRTLMTSATTVAVLVALVLFGGSSIFGFSFVMLVGVLLGTLSSLFIACPILLYLHNREESNSHAKERR